jgi:DNA-binding transcriptional ArsR family regulator
MTAADPGDAWGALADPTRRAVLDLLKTGPHRAGELSDALGLAPPLLSRHLRVLRHAGLIADEEPPDDARVRLYRLQPAALSPLREWIDELESFWSDQLQAFKQHAETRRSPAAKSSPNATARARRKP